MPSRGFWRDYIVSLRQDFVRSSIATADALDAGVPAYWLAQEFKSLIQEDRRLHRTLYTSAASVLFHARTGRIMYLPGFLPDGVCARDVQSAIMNLPAAVVDRLIRRATSQEDAWMRLDSLTAQ